MNFQFSQNERYTPDANVFTISSSDIELAQRTLGHNHYTPQVISNLCVEYELLMFPHEMTKSWAHMHRKDPWNEL